MGPSSSDSVATLEKKFGKTFSEVCMGFVKKSQLKTGNFDQKRVKQNRKNRKSKFYVFKQKNNKTI